MSDSTEEKGGGGGVTDKEEEKPHIHPFIHLLPDVTLLNFFRPFLPRPTFILDFKDNIGFFPMHH